MSKRTSNPGIDELKLSLDKILAEVPQLFSFFSWQSLCKTILPDNIKDFDNNPDMMILRNSVLSGFLLSVRKLNEFFKKMKVPDLMKRDLFSLLL